MALNKIAIMIATRDRPTELSLLLQSLRTQTIKNFDIFILEDYSGTPLQNYHFLVCLINKLNEEGNFVRVDRTPFNYGVSKARQQLVKMVKETRDYEYMCRLDDDVILEHNYLEQLMEVIVQGYDLASGVTEFIGAPSFMRESRFIKPVANKVILDKEGKFIYNGDSCGMLCLDKSILPIHHFRSCALYKTKIHDKVSYDSKLTKHGFREEEILSFKMIINGFKLGMNTKAIAHHLLTPSGGERFAESNEMVKTNQEVLEEFTKDMYKEHGDFIIKYNDLLGIKVNMPSNEELISPENLVRV